MANMSFTSSGKTSGGPTGPVPRMPVTPVTAAPPTPAPLPPLVSSADSVRPTPTSPGPWRPVAPATPIPYRAPDYQPPANGQSYGWQPIPSTAPTKRETKALEGTLWNSLYGNPAFTNSLADFSDARAKAMSDYAYGNQYRGLDRTSAQNAAAFQQERYGMTGNQIAFDRGRLGKEAEFTDREQALSDKRFGLAGKGFERSKAQIEHDAYMQRVMNQRDHAARGAHISGSKEVALGDIATNKQFSLDAAKDEYANAGFSREGNQISFDRAREALSAKSFDLDQAAQSLGIDRRELDVKLQDTLTRLGLDGIVDLDFFNQTNSKLSRDETAFMQTMKQEVGSMILQDYSDDGLFENPMFDGYHQNNMALAHMGPQPQQGPNARQWLGW